MMNNRYTCAVLFSGILMVSAPASAQLLVNPTGVQFDHPTLEQQVTDTYRVEFFAAGATVPIVTYDAPKILATCVVQACTISIASTVNQLVATQGGRGVGFTIKMKAINTIAGASGASLPSGPFSLMGVPLAPTAVTPVRQ